MVEPNKDGELELECDEVWSFVGSKQNPQWLWLTQEGNDAFLEQIVSRLGLEPGVISIRWRIIEQEFG